MHLPLKPHPESRPPAGTRIEVEVRREDGGRLRLAYVVTGIIADIRLPPAAPSERTDGLWQHTCFEAFLRATSGEAYYEVNVAPSTQWAAYRFDGYRSGMRIAEESPTPAITVLSRPDGIMVEVMLDLSRITALPDESPWHLGLSAVIEDAQGGLSYWALAHPPGKPDFHHATGFACEISPV